MSFNYKKAGVDVHKGDALVDWLMLNQSNDQVNTQDNSSNQTYDNNFEFKTSVDKNNSGIGMIGGFASIVKLPFHKYKNPLLVTCTDGVGTKIKLAAQFKKHFDVAQDLVAMCVNDLICCGADPYIFLDYYAVAELDLEDAKEFLRGVQQACKKSYCNLVGGETAEMPGVYHKPDFDCAGFAVGLVDQEDMWGAHQVQSSDILIGVSSSGFHSNGYSLVRKLFEPEIQTSDVLNPWIQKILAPTHLYVELVKKIKQQNIQVHAAAHITGGGIENIPRVLPSNLKYVRQAWPMSDLFLEAQKRSQLTDQEMLETFNCGVGFVFVIPADSESKIKQVIKSCGYESFNIGHLTPIEVER